MTEQLEQMGERIKALRDIMDIDQEDMARRCEMSLQEYTDYEDGKRDFSFSFLNNVAHILNIDVLDIMSGDSPKLSAACVVKGGDGFEINRRESYNYRHLAYTFKDKLAEPFMVTVEPSQNNAPTKHAHEGQEFNYVVDGEMNFYIGEMTYVLSKGDSVYFDSGLPHAMRANNERPCQFLAIVMKKEM